VESALSGGGKKKARCKRRRSGKGSLFILMNIFDKTCGKKEKIKTHAEEGKERGKGYSLPSRSLKRRKTEGPGKPAEKKKHRRRGERWYFASENHPKKNEESWRFGTQRGEADCNFTGIEQEKKG